ncbi:hypothetical protein L7F22_053788, partial [Adiantum nelumboides]|nr:hypothetical protein [Adiantum nelumboides]
MIMYGGLCESGSSCPLKPVKYGQICCKLCDSDLSSLFRTKCGQTEWLWIRKRLNISIHIEDSNVKVKMLPEALTSATRHAVLKTLEHATVELAVDEDTLMGTSGHAELKIGEHARVKRHACSFNYVFEAREDVEILTRTSGVSVAAALSWWRPVRIYGDGDF